MCGEEGESKASEYVSLTREGGGGGGGVDLPGAAAHADRRAPRVATKAALNGVVDAQLSVLSARVRGGEVSNGGGLARSGTSNQHLHGLLLGVEAERALHRSLEVCDRRGRGQDDLGVQQSLLDGGAGERHSDEAGHG